MKLSEYAKKAGITYRTAWQWYKDGRLKGYQAETGTIIIDDQPTQDKSAKIAVYARVSSSENKSNLDSQADRLVAYCMAKGWQVTQVVKEIGSGVNDNRPKFLSLLADTSITLIVVEHKDRATRFGYNYIATLLGTQDRQLEVVNLADNGKDFGVRASSEPQPNSAQSNEDLMQDLVSIIYSFSARMYGQRRAKRKTEIIVKELQDQNDAAS